MEIGSAVRYILCSSFRSYNWSSRMASIFVFGFDLGEAAQIRSIRSLLACGHTVRSATMRRRNMNLGFEPEWPNIHLYHVENEHFARRLVTTLAAIAKMARQRDAITGADVIVARNFDMLLIAWATRWLSGERATPLVYECLDIHGLFTRADAFGDLMRWWERRLLGRTDLVIVSSPAFIREYFHRVQDHRGPITLLENKLWFDGPPVPRPGAPRARELGEPLSVGWVGSIRCLPSFRVLLAAADAMGPDLRLRIFGNVHHHAVPSFQAEVARRDNVEYHGSYAYPHGLAAAYAACDLVWAQDLWQRGANSDWLLPNRIYEASWFGCPSVAVADTETGRRVAETGSGSWSAPRTRGRLSTCYAISTTGRCSNAAQACSPGPTIISV